MALFDVRMKLSETLMVNIYLLGEDKYGLLESQRNNARKHTIKIHHKNEESFRLNPEQVNILWVTEKGLDVSKEIFSAFDRIFHPRDIESLVSLIKNKPEKQSKAENTYYCLKKEMNQYFNHPVENIVLGASYSRYGILKSEATFDFVKLTYNGQDMYSAYHILNYFLEHSTQSLNIKRCILPVGHWIFFRDISKGTNPNATITLTTFMDELFGAIHHFKEEFVPDFYDSLSTESGFDVHLTHYFDMEKLQTQVFQHCFERKEEILLPLHYRNYKSMNFYDKINASKATTSRFANMLKYQKTYTENMEIFSNLIDLLAEHQIELTILLAPFTRTYHQVLDPDLKKSYEQSIFNTCSRFRYFDMNILPEVSFLDEDFLDEQHLNEKGALKFTQYLNQMIAQDKNAD